ncbi:hypothetical protein [Anaerobiospirillum succiniciproducens]|uniref:hypothetical protein n=1 Tax=Anaerobiospirillum succiniciproducens TaxID=13335 RepID=UPI00294323FF|nr:hypothetical protein [Anaerobiospirillum succiniciproducens]
MKLLKVLSWAFLTAAFIFAAAPSYADDDNDGFRGIGDAAASIFTGDNDRYDDDDDDDDDRRWGRDRDDDDDDDRWDRDRDDDDDDDDDRRWGRDRDDDDDDDD